MSPRASSSKTIYLFSIKLRKKKLAIPCLYLSPKRSSLLPLPPPLIQTWHLDVSSSIGDLSQNWNSLPRSQRKYTHESILKTRNSELVSIIMVLCYSLDWWAFTRETNSCLEGNHLYAHISKVPSYVMLHKYLTI